MGATPPPGPSTSCCIKAKPISINWFIDTLHFYLNRIARENIGCGFYQVKVYISSICKIIVNSKNSIHLYPVYCEYKPVLVYYAFGGSW